MSTKKLRKYQADNILVTYDAKRCIHAAECVRGLPAVFDVDKRPWIQPNQASANDVAEVVMRCPTGALQFQRSDGGADESIPERNTIIPDPNGPLYLHGDIEIKASDGSALLQDTRVALCRCGASKNKPFCDGSHHQIAFQASGEVGESRLGQNESTDGKLVVTLVANGPFLLKGQVNLQSADGHTTHQGGKGALCRCGESKNKPFCDGSHTQIGFEAE